MVKESTDARDGQSPIATILDQWKEDLKFIFCPSQKLQNWYANHLDYETAIANAMLSITKTYEDNPSVKPKVTTIFTCSNGQAWFLQGVLRTSTEENKKCENAKNTLEKYLSPSNATLNLVKARDQVLEMKITYELKVNGVTKNQLRGPVQRTGYEDVTKRDTYDVIHAYEECQRDTTFQCGTYCESADKLKLRQGANRYCWSYNCGLWSRDSGSSFGAGGFAMSGCYDFKEQRCLIDRGGDSPCTQNTGLLFRQVVKVVGTISNYENMANTSWVTQCSKSLVTTTDYCWSFTCKNVEESRGGSSMSQVGCYNRATHKCVRDDGIMKAQSFASWDFEENAPCTQRAVYHCQHGNKPKVAYDFCWSNGCGGVTKSTGNGMIPLGLGSGCYRMSSQRCVEDDGHTSIDEPERAPCSAYYAYHCTWKMFQETTDFCWAFSCFSVLAKDKGGRRVRGCYNVRTRSCVKDDQIGSTGEEDTAPCTNRQVSSCSWTVYSSKYCLQTQCPAEEGGKGCYDTDSKQCVKDGGDALDHGGSPCTAEGVGWCNWRFQPGDFCWTRACKNVKESKNTKALLYHQGCFDSQKQTCVRDDGNFHLGENDNIAPCTTRRAASCYNTDWIGGSTDYCWSYACAKINETKGGDTMSSSGCLNVNEGKCVKDEGMTQLDHNESTSPCTFRNVFHCAYRTYDYCKLEMCPHGKCWHIPTSSCVEDAEKISMTERAPCTTLGVGPCVFATTMNLYCKTDTCEGGCYHYGEGCVQHKKITTQTRGSEEYTPCDVMNVGQCKLKGLQHLNLVVLTDHCKFRGCENGGCLNIKTYTCVDKSYCNNESVYTCQLPQFVPETNYCLSKDCGQNGCYNSKLHQCVKIEPKLKINGITQPDPCTLYGVSTCLYYKWSDYCILDACRGIPESNGCYNLKTNKCVKNNASNVTWTVKGTSDDQIALGGLPQTGQEYYKMLENSRERHYRGDNDSLVRQYSESQAPCTLTRAMPCVPKMFGGKCWSFRCGEKVDQPFDLSAPKIWSSTGMFFTSTATKERYELSKKREEKRKNAEALLTTEKMADKSTQDVVDAISKLKSIDQTWLNKNQAYWKYIFCPADRFSGNVDEHEDMQQRLKALKSIIDLGSASNIGEGDVSRLFGCKESSQRKAIDMRSTSSGNDGRPVDLEYSAMEDLQKSGEHVWSWLRWWRSASGANDAHEKIVPILKHGKTKDSPFFRTDACKLLLQVDASGTELTMLQYVARFSNSDSMLTALLNVAQANARSLGERKYCLKVYQGALEQAVLAKQSKSATTIVDSFTSIFQSGNLRAQDVQDYLIENKASDDNGEDNKMTPDVTSGCYDTKAEQCIEDILPSRLTDKIDEAPCSRNNALHCRYKFEDYCWAKACGKPGMPTGCYDIVAKKCVPDTKEYKDIAAAPCTVRGVTLCMPSLSPDNYCLSPLGCGNVGGCYNVVTQKCVQNDELSETYTELTAERSPCKIYRSYRCYLKTFSTTDYCWSRTCRTVRTSQGGTELWPIMPFRDLFGHGCYNVKTNTCVKDTGQVKLDSFEDAPCTAQYVHNCFSLSSGLNYCWSMTCKSKIGAHMACWDVEKRKCVVDNGLPSPGLPEEQMEEALTNAPCSMRSVWSCGPVKSGSNYCWRWQASADCESRCYDKVKQTCVPNNEVVDENNQEASPCTLQLQPHEYCIGSANTHCWYGSKCIKLHGILEVDKNECKMKASLSSWDVNSQCTRGWGIGYDYRFEHAAKETKP
eukprot:TRINITY_DN22685_c0_g6_i3.p1 TRINITY_DN22685_c0_g6~~TRINITY_DN22685_c0_g6_i3.p1  ORF type:complete len:1949 (+),score=140.30 TRINITY_DN22685_c0_g6_i3:632-5848(+)